MRDQVLLNIVQAGVLIERDKSVASRMASAGKFGKPVMRGRRKHYRLSEVERAAGKTFTADQVSAALGAHVGPLRRDVKLGITRILLAARDLEWREHLEGLGIEPPEPPAFHL
jgi:hypothetical protein